MEITKGSDLILILKLEDFKGKKLRVEECADFRLYVWTANRNNFLQFSKKDISIEEKIDKIAIPDFMMNCLESGVICYQYRYSKLDGHFNITDGHYDKSKIVVSDLYWRNCNLNEEPANPVNYQTLNYLKNLIENESLERQKDVYDIKELLKNTDVIDALKEELAAEIKRSNEVDVEMLNLIKNNQSELDNKATEISVKLDDEVKRSNEVDTELFNLIKSNGNETKEELNETNDKVDDAIKKLYNEITRATNAETIIDTKIEGEIERAKTSEGAIRDAVENERDRAIAKETLINETLLTKIDNEIERAKDREQHINDDLHDEIARAKAEEKRIEDIVIANASKDTELTEKVNAEIERAKTAEKEINDVLNDEVKRATDKDAELSDLIANLDTLIGDEVKRSSDADKTLTDALNGVQNDLTSEVARATAEEGRIESKIDTNADNLTSEIARAKQVESEITTALQTLKTTVIDNYATHKEVDNRISEVIGTAPEALDTLGEIANVLNGNGDAIEAINGVLLGKVNADEVYTKNEVDTTITGINNTISTIQSEMAVVNGDKDTIGSINHSLEDAKHYTDDRVAELKAEENVKLANFATKNEVAAISDTVYAHITEADEKYQPKGNYLTEHQSLEGLATEEYVNEKIDEIDLTDYALKTDIPDAYDDTEIKEQLADLTSKLDNIDVPEIDLSDYVKKDELKSVEDTVNAHITEADEKYQPKGDYLTEHQSLEGYATEEYVNDKLADINVENSTSKTYTFEDSNISSYFDRALSATLEGKEYTSNIIDTTKLSENDLNFLTNLNVGDTIIYYNTRIVYLYGEKDTISYYYFIGDNIKKQLGCNYIILRHFTNNNMMNIVTNKSAIQPRLTAGNGIAIDETTNTISADVPEIDLSEYAKTSETTVIKDNDGNIITEMVIDNSDADDTIEVYTKEQCDEKFAQIWVGTQAEYDALSVKNNNTIYVIQ